MTSLTARANKSSISPNPFRFLPVALLGSIISLAMATPLAAAPNIVVFFSDDHTQQSISAYQDLTTPTPQDLVFKDSALAKTPNIDRLAAQGAVFSRSYVSNSIS